MKPPLPMPDLPAGATARTAKGQAAIDKILGVAIELLAHEGHAALSMRKVAERLNMRLSAVQHHFPAWEDLMQAMMQRVQAEYKRVIDEHIQETKSSRLKQFEHVLNFLMRDIKSPVSQSLFAQIWALAQTNLAARNIMRELYDYERQVFAFFVAQLNPALDAREAARRAALMVTQIEGLMLLIPQQSRFPADLAGIERTCIDLILALAQAPAADAAS